MNYKITLLGVLVITMLMINTTHIFAQENLVLNGDFEVNTQENPEADIIWKKNNADISMRDWDNVDNQINGGTCRMPGPAKDRNIRQDIEIPTPGIYTLQFTGRIQNSNGPDGSAPNDRDGQGPGTLTATITGFDTDGETLLSDPLITLSTQSNTNKTVTKEFEIPETVTKVRIVIAKDWNIAFVDDVKLFSTTSGFQQPSVEGLCVFTENNSIKLMATHALSVVHVFNVDGKLIQTVNSKGMNHVSIDSCVKGVYLISITDAFGNTGKIKHIVY